MSVYYMSVCMSLVDVCMSMCEGTNIKTPAEGLQTQDVAVRVKIAHSCAYSSAQDVPPSKQNDNTCAPVCCCRLNMVGTQGLRMHI